jgi:hypothetical protein
MNNVIFTCKSIYDALCNEQRHTCDLLWYEYCRQQLNCIVRCGKQNTTTIDSSKFLKYSSYKQQYRDLFRFDTLICEKMSMKFSDNKRYCMFDYGRPVSFIERWEVVRVNFCMIPGYIYEFEVVIHDLQETSTNKYLVSVGIIDTEAKIDYTEIGLGNWIGREGNGIAFTLGVKDYSHSKSFILRNQCNSIQNMLKLFYSTTDFTFKNGDTIGVQVDMTRASPEYDNKMKQFGNGYGLLRTDEMMEQLRSGGTSISYYLNGNAIMTGPINGIIGQEFYPAVSLTSQQAVLIRPGFSDEIPYNK